MPAGVSLFLFWAAGRVLRYSPWPHTGLRRQRAGAPVVALPVPLHLGMRLPGLPLRPLPQGVPASLKSRIPYPGR